MQFKSRYGEPLVRVLNAYQPGSPGLIAALEAICKTAENVGHKRASNDLSMTVCEGLHKDPPTGIKCLDCYHAETGYAAMQQVQDEMALVAKAKAEGGSTDLIEPEPQPASDELGDAELSKILTELGHNE